jgi:hypothetical protein
MVHKLELGETFAALDTLGRRLLAFFDLMVGHLFDLDSLPAVLARIWTRVKVVVKVLNNTPPNDKPPQYSSHLT